MRAAARTYACVRGALGVLSGDRADGADARVVRGCADATGGGEAPGAAANTGRAPRHVSSPEPVCELLSYRIGFPTSQAAQEQSRSG